jgi:hypothetical protein
MAPSTRPLPPWGHAGRDQKVDTLSVLSLALGGGHDDFTYRVLELTAHADPANRARMARTWPRLVAAWEVWKMMDPCPTAAEIGAIWDRLGAITPPSTWGTGALAPDQKVSTTTALAKFLCGDDDSFTGNLLRLMQHADRDNARRLGQAFPREWAALHTWLETLEVPTAAELAETLTGAGRYPVIE